MSKNEQHNETQKVHKSMREDAWRRSEAQTGAGGSQWEKLKQLRREADNVVTDSQKQPGK